MTTALAKPNQDNITANCQYCYVANGIKDPVTVLHYQNLHLVSKSFVIFSTDFSDSETLEMDDMYTVPEVIPENRRSSLEEPADVKAEEKKRKRPRPYRRSHSLAEIRRPTAIFIPEGRRIFVAILISRSYISSNQSNQ